MEKAKDVMVGGSSNILSPEPIIEGTPVEVSQDLMNKFTMAVVDLGDDSDVTVFSKQTVSVEKEQNSAAIINLEGSATVHPTVQRRKSVAKRVSPSNTKEDEDDNTPLKLLKRAVKIEKIV
ncbi:replication factor-A carboxy-terminal domain protein [Trifolium medium]|uniref:Replication factor-A carboxy-terminal domain protein n=1 Tax=Trifolium medium TaxID=97028 RepID=A0A392PXX9_9FABA|nr:replication factor-A carboxy-terminal domain protein [Trifolium medium]